MAAGHLYQDALQPPLLALARGAALLDALSPEHPLALYGAELDRAAVVLGAYQHAAQALRAEAIHAAGLPIVRRHSGGAAVLAAPGVLYAALALQHASVLMTCPPGRILNRNVRGLLAGVRALGVQAHYFGRDFVSAAAEPFAYVAYAERDDGRVLLEFFIGLDAVFSLPAELDGYPARSEPALRGKTPTTLRAKGATADASAVLAGIAEGYARSHGVSFDAAALPDHTRAQASTGATSMQVALNAEPSLSWSMPREEAIGFVSAGVALADDGCLHALELGGDFFQHAACPHQLATRLLGRAPTPESVGAALDAVYGARPGLIEGVRSLNTLRDAIIDAVARARAH